MYAVEVDTGNRHCISEKNLHINYIQPPEERWVQCVHCLRITFICMYSLFLTPCTHTQKLYLTQQQNLVCGNNKHSENVCEHEKKTCFASFLLEWLLQQKYSTGKKK